MDEVIWTVDATSDLQEIYSDVGCLRGDQLVTRADAALSLLRVFPEQGPVYFGTLRRLSVGRDRRYGLFYVIEGRRLVVSAFVDLRQDLDLLTAMLKKRTNG